MVEAARYPRRNLWAALRDGAVWLSGPVSERGAARAFRVAVNLGGPVLHERRLAMRAHPEGRRLLDERPDLCAALGDMAALAALPEGSLGRAYHAFMDHPETIPGYMLSGLVYKDGWFDSIPMDAELRWAFERWIQTHDLMHVVGGYGADLPGEGLNIYFTLGYCLGLSWLVSYWSPFGLAPRLMRPQIPRAKWLGLLRDAWQRGQAARAHLPFECVPWEDLLPRPVGEARAYIGLPPISDAARLPCPSAPSTSTAAPKPDSSTPAPDPARLPDPAYEMLSAGWREESWFTRHLLAPDVDYDAVSGVKAAVASGVAVRALMSADDATRREIERLALRGEPLSRLEEALAT